MVRPDNVQREGKNYTLPGRANLSGGLAEWPTSLLKISRLGNQRTAGPINGCTLQVQLADKPDPANVVIDFTEKSASATIGFLLPHPLQEHKAEFETGLQMVARQLKWAMEASNNQAPKLQKFDVITSLWRQYDPVLTEVSLQTLKQLGFNVGGTQSNALMQKYDLRASSVTWNMWPDPDESITKWASGDGKMIAAALATPEGVWRYEHTTHFVVCDEIQTLHFDQVNPDKLNGWFRDYLRSKGETDVSMGVPIDTIVYPVKEVRAKALPRDADLSTRKTLYYAAKFGQYWSVKALRQTTDLVHDSFKTLPNGMRTETLPSDGRFLGVWGAPACGMDPGGLDFFEIGSQQAVDIISTEDWLGLNHMYGPFVTCGGGWTFEYMGAIFRSGIGDNPVALRGLVTPSDDNYLRLKTYSLLAQGAKSFFFWSFGPTYLGTENYWSDLRSMYDGIAKTVRALAKSEDVLFPAKPVRDPVAVLYSVSHDYWHTDDPAGFVENRMTWTALRQLGIQPDFLREEDVEAGKLVKYKVLYITSQNLTRKSSAAIDAWVKQGGVVYLAAGAATRDEFCTPYVPDFAKTVWPADAAQVFTAETGHLYLERHDLPTITPLTTATVTAGGQTFDMKVIGCRQPLRDALPANAILATFADGKPAGAQAAYGKGTVIAVGFLPGLAYSPFKPRQTTLDEVWASAPRELFRLPLTLGLKGAQNVHLSVPVVEGSLLTGAQGSALILANYTYQPLKALTVRLTPTCKFKTATSTEGVRVLVKKTHAGTELTLPLDCTDIIVLK